MPTLNGDKDKQTNDMTLLVSLYIIITNMYVHLSHIRKITYLLTYLLTY